MATEELFEKYQKAYGEIVFPDDDINVLREIWRNPVGWMYSFDGIQWEAAPMDIGKIDYSHALFRKEQPQTKMGQQPRLNLLTDISCTVGEAQQDMVNVRVERTFSGAGAIPFYAERLVCYFLKNSIGGYGLYNTLKRFVAFQW